MSPRRALIFLLLLLACGFALYGSALSNSYQLDDASSISENRVVRDGDIAGAAGFWPGRAVVYASFAAHSRFFGLGPAGMRIGNILGHGIAAFALGWFLYGMLRIRVPARDPLPAAALAALFFLVHPLQTQAVTYVVQRAASWAAMFSLLGLATYGHAFRARHATRWRLLSLLFVLLAMFCKEYAAVLPLILVVVDFEFGGREGRWRRLAPVVLSLGVVPLTAALGQSFGEFGSDSLVAQSEKISRADYFFAQIEVTVRYAMLTLFPMGQNVDHDIAAHGFEPSRTLLWSLPHLAAWIGAILLHRRGHGIAAFCVAFAYLSILPESSFFPIHDLMFEHRAYLALGGAAMLFGLALARLRRSRPRLAWVAAGIVLAALSTATVLRNEIWNDAESLWSDAIAKSPRKTRPRYALGVAYAEQGRLQEAKRQFELAIEYGPTSARAWTNLGKAHLALGDRAEAIRCFDHILRLRPDHVSAWYHLGVARDRAAQLDEAREAYLRALELDPEHTLSLNALASVELKRGDAASAKRYAERAARLGAPAPRLLEAIRARS